jgi:hypothetical protein
LADRGAAACLCPELNLVEGVRANMKNGLGNLAACYVSQLAAIVKDCLKSIQYPQSSSASSSPRPA